MDSSLQVLKEKTTDIFNPLTEKEIVSFILNNDEEAISIYDKFGDKDFNNKWIYISDNMKREYLTNDKGDNAIDNVNRRVIQPILGESCKNIKKKEMYDLVLNPINCSIINLPSLEDIKQHKGKIYTIMTGECLKFILLSSKTASGKKVRNYFVQIENGFRLLSEYSAYITNEVFKEEMRLKDEKLREQEEQLKKDKLFKMNMSGFYNNLQRKSKTHFVYIATTQNYASKNLFKIGKTETSLKCRLFTYNTGRPQDDLYYFCKSFKCCDSKQLEYRFNSILSKFKEKENKEMYRIHYKPLEKIFDFVCENYDNEVNLLNELIESLLSQYSNEIPFIPDPIPIDESKSISFENNDKNQKIEATSLSDVEFDILKDIVERYIESKTEKKISITKDNTTSFIKQIEWWNIKDDLDKNMRTLAWRNKMKVFCKSFNITDKFLVLHQK